MFGMGITHGTAGPMEIVFIFVGLDMSYSKHEPIKSKWRVTHQSYTPFDSVLLCLYLCVLFDLLEVGVLYFVVGVRLGLLSALEA